MNGFLLAVNSMDGVWYWGIRPGVPTFRRRFR